MDFAGVKFEYNKTPEQHKTLLAFCRETLRKQAYSNILKFLQPKNENFQIKILIFCTFLLKIDCWYSLESPR